MTSVTFDRLFNSAAIVSLGRWEMGFEDERTSGISGLEQEVVERRWAKAVQRRRDEVSSPHSSVLISSWNDRERKNLLNVIPMTRSGRL